MKINSTVALTLVLLILMVAAGVVSAAWGYALGREALKGITQPDVRPSNALEDTAGAPRREEVPILRESDILADVKARMEGRARSASPSNASPSNRPASSTPTGATSPTPSASPIVATSPIASQTGLQIAGQDQGITLEVRSVRQENGTLVMDVNLQNRGSRSVKFLYSFMNVTDDRGRSFSANTEGLPGELVPNGESFSGTVSIPMALLDGANQLSLSLTDYPDQQVQLQLSGIPVVR